MVLALNSVTPNSRQTEDSLSGSKKSQHHIIPILTSRFSLSLQLRFQVGLFFSNNSLSFQRQHQQFAGNHSYPI
ncbi:Uncharacterised protein [Helicobacter pametensis]|nr:Uncharacterised protein [Helicobacter pametensis]